MVLTISPIQVFGLVLIVLAMSKTIADFHRHRETKIMFGFWMILWVTIIILTIFPELTELARKFLLGPNQSVGTIIGTGMIFLIFLVYRIYIKTERIERILRERVSDLALNKIYHKFNNEKK